MKALIILAMTGLTAICALPRLQNLPSLNTVLASPTPAPSGDGANANASAISAASTPAEISADEVRRNHGDPVRIERNSNGMETWYYPVYVIYIRNGRLADLRSSKCMAGSASNQSTLTQPSSNTTAVALWRPAFGSHLQLSTGLSPQYQRSGTSRVVTSTGTVVAGGSSGPAGYNGTTAFSRTTGSTSGACMSQNQAPRVVAVPRTSAPQSYPRSVSTSPYTAVSH
jgi:hypothetical protein